MTDELTPGLHEALITEALRARIERARAQGWLVEWKEMDDGILAKTLARHVHDRVQERMEGLPLSLANRRGAQVELANRVLEALAAYGDESRPIDRVESNPGVLLEAEPVLDGPMPSLTPRPGISLRDSVLLVNGHRDLQIGTQVALEIQSADRVDLLSAFVRFAGVRLIRRELTEFLLHGGEMRVICTVYTGSTEKRALDELVGLGCEGQGLLRDFADPLAREGLALRTQLRLPHCVCGLVEPDALSPARRTRVERQGDRRRQPGDHRASSGDVRAVLE